MTGDEAQLARRWKPFASRLAFFAKLTDYRNNINHGQVTDQRFTYDQVASSLADFYNNTRGLINSLHEIPRG